MVSQQDYSSGTIIGGAYKCIRFHFEILFNQLPQNFTPESFTFQVLLQPSVAGQINIYNAGNASSTNPTQDPNTQFFSVYSNGYDANNLSHGVLQIGATPLVYNMLNKLSQYMIVELIDNSPVFSYLHIVSASVIVHGYYTNVITPAIGL